MTLALCMLIKNHVNVIANTIASVKPLVNEIVCLDYGSKDDSAGLAHRNGAKIISSDFKGSFSDLRNKVIDEVKSEWILFLEPGELLPISEHVKIKNAMKKDFAGYLCRVIHPNNSYNEVVKLFRTGKGYRYRYRVYEAIGESISEKNGKIAKTDITVVNTMVKQIPVFREYSELLEKDFKDSPENEKILHLMALMKADKKEYNEAIDLLERAIRKSASERYVNDLLMIKKLKESSENPSAEGGVKFQFTDEKKPKKKKSSSVKK